MSAPVVATSFAAAAWPRDAQLRERMMVLDTDGTRTHAHIGALTQWLRAGDLVVLNDAATVPASLHGVAAQGVRIELRLAGSTADASVWTAVLFGDGDWRTRTEHRAAPPSLVAGDVLHFDEGLSATIVVVSPQSSRLVTVRFNARDDQLWRALYAQGAPVQYAHVAAPLPLWHVQTAYAGRPWAVEMPSAGRPLRWSLLGALRAQGVVLARLTHAAGLSATGDDALDAVLPLPERYQISAETARAVAETKARGGRVVAVGTSVVRALEGCAATHGHVVADTGVTSLKLGAGSPLRVVDAVLSGMHEPATSHFALLTAFAREAVLLDAVVEGARRGYLTHEFGDLCLVFRAR
jgi:S-adenosylmethionine:tRNA ribosyltransferase-isomerase